MQQLAILTQRQSQHFCDVHAANRIAHEFPRNRLIRHVHARLRLHHALCHALQKPAQERQAPGNHDDPEYKPQQASNKCHF